jgi:hypothetical protein
MMLNTNMLTLSQKAILLSLDDKKHKHTFLSSEVIIGKVKTKATPRISVTFICISPDYFS